MEIAIFIGLVIGILVIRIVIAKTVDGMFDGFFGLFSRRSRSRESAADVSGRGFQQPNQKF